MDAHYDTFPPSNGFRKYCSVVLGLWSFTKEHGVDGIAQMNSFRGVPTNAALVGCLMTPSLQIRMLFLRFRKPLKILVDTLTLSIYVDNTQQSNKYIPY